MDMKDVFAVIGLFLIINGIVNLLLELIVKAVI